MLDRSRLADLHRLARRQGGVFSADQADQLGVTPAQRRSRVTSGVWVPVQPGVYAPGGVPLSELALLWSVWLAVGRPMAFTGAAAARLWGCQPLPPVRVVDVVLPVGRDPRALLHVRKRRVPNMPAVAYPQGLPSLTTAHALVDLAARQSDRQCQDVLQEALRLRRCTESDLLAATGRGRRGSARIRAALQVVGDGADSVWERRLVRECVAAGLPRPTRPLLHASISNRYLRPDLYWPGVVVEVDGVLAHASGAALTEDAQRQNALVAELGLVVLRYTPADIRDRGALVVAEISRAVLARGVAGQG